MALCSRLFNCSDRCSSLSYSSWVGGGGGGDEDEGEEGEGEGGRGEGREGERRVKGRGESVCGEGGVPFHFPLSVVYSAATHSVVLH